jgi:hypothetical protein
MPDLITLADLPELAGDDPSPRTTITVARLDNNLHDPRYGKFGITQADVDGWKRNLSEVFGGRVSIDADHSSDRGKGTKASAWITGLSQQGKKVQAAVEFTPAGAKQVRDREYLYISPTFVENYVDEHKVGHGKALLGAALTNRPVLRQDMPTLSLSRDPFDGVATVEGKKNRKQRKQASRARAHASARVMELARDAASDSRRRMDLKELAKQMGLDEDADHATVLAAVAAIEVPTTDTDTTAADKAAKDAKAAKKLAKKTKKKGRKLMGLSAKETAKLLSDANAGQAASVQLAEQTFDTEFAKTLSEGRVGPDQEDTLRALFRENPDLAVKTLKSLHRIIPMTPRGSGDGGTEALAAPAGVDQDRFQLHREAIERAKTLAKEQDISPDEAYALAAIELDEQHAEQAARGF